MIDIVITNYNYARFLRAAIDSALGQTNCACQVIVVDDGSPDGSREIIRAYSTRIIPVFQDHAGQAAAFNAGWQLCRGQAVIFLDADDVLLPDTAHRVEKIFRTHPGVAMVQYRMAVIDARGNPTGALKPAGYLQLARGDLREAIINFPDDLTRMATSGNAFAAFALKEILPIPADEYGAAGADWYLSHLTPLSGYVIALDHVGAGYRVHGANSYEIASPRVDLVHIRQTIAYAETTHRYIHKFAVQRGLKTPAEIMSVSSVANRLISVRLDPAQHPVAHDTAGKLLRLGIRASLRRSDIAPVMRVMFMVWFVLMAIAPRFIAHWLAVKFLFPEARVAFNRWLGALHRPTPAEVRH